MKKKYFRTSALAASGRAKPGHGSGFGQFLRWNLRFVLGVGILRRRTNARFRLELGSNAKVLYLLTIFLVFLAIGAYLYLSRVYIYREIDWAGLKPPDKNQTLLINNSMNTDKKLTYDALGDSLTAGVGVLNYEQSYPYLVAQKLSAGSAKVTLNNRSIPGAKTSELKNELLDLAVKDQPDVITILIGVNDVHGKVSVAEFKDNYEEIIKRLAKETRAKIYLVNIPFIGAPKLVLPPYNYYFDWKTKRFNAVIKALAETYQAGYVDLYSPTAAQFKKSGAHYSPDLFHPSAEGYALWAEIIYDHINK